MKQGGPGQEVLREEVAGHKRDRGQVVDAGLGSAAQGLVMVDTMLLSATYFLLAQRHVGHLT